MRLDKFLCDCGIGSRSEVKKLIKAKAVCVNGQTVSAPEAPVDEGDEITCKGQPVRWKGDRYYLFYKPAGCITATEDRSEKTVLDYFPEEERKKLSPAGRLDKDTEGLLILTTDGALLHHLISPRHEVCKTYYARLDAPVPSEAVQRFREGIDIGDEKPTAPAELSILSEAGNEAELTIREGRYHQVKRMFHAVGCEVVYLKRIKEGALTLGDLKPGCYRELTENEIREVSK